MKKSFFFFVVFNIGLFLNGQELSGVWLSGDNLLPETSKRSLDTPGKTVLNIDAKTLSNLTTNHNIKFKTNRKKTKFKIKGVKGKLVLDYASKELIVLKGADNTKYTFQKAKTGHTIAMNERQLKDFLVEQQCDLIYGIKGKFTKEQYFVDKKAKKPVQRYQFINFNENSNGYWSIRKIDGNAILIFEAGQNQYEGIFQITKVKVNGFDLVPLLKDNPMRGLTTIKTCL